MPRVCVHVCVCVCARQGRGAGRGAAIVQLVANPGNRHGVKLAPPRGAHSTARAPRALLTAAWHTRVCARRWPAGRPHPGKRHTHQKEVNIQHTCVSSLSVGKLMCGSQTSSQQPATGLAWF
jgi:hypothetical protein